MAKVRKASESETTGPLRPALTPESRENQLISLAVDLVEKRLREGTASSQETTHFLKLATTRARLEKEILEKQRDLITAKTEEIHSRKEQKELYEEALKAMRRYNGQGESDEY